MESKTIIINKIINKTKIDFKFIDLGGGMGISYSKKEKQINLKQYAKLINKFIKGKHSKIIFEPGRFILGNTAILITKIILVSVLIIVAAISIPIISLPGDTFLGMNLKSFKHALEWDYFIGVISFYLLTFMMWKKK